MIYRSYHSKGAANYGKTEPAPGTDALIENLVAASDDAQRKVLAQQVMEKIHPSGERIIPYFQNYIAATSERVQNYVVPKYNIMELRWIWLTA
jgi:peptide/nickel transport system substrate-binding protein